MAKRFSDDDEAKDLTVDELLEDLRSFAKQRGALSDDEQAVMRECFRELDKRMSDPDGEAPEDWGGGGDDEDDEGEDGEE